MKIKAFALAAIVCCNLTIIKAQTEAELSIKPFGVGLHLEQFKLNDISDLTTAPVNKIIVTINPSHKFRIESEIGFRSGKDGETDLKSSSTSFGVGLFGMTQRNKLNIYGGMRIEYGIISEEINGYQAKITDKLKRLMIGPALGGEYFFGDNFSLAGEVSLLYVKLNESIDPNVYSDPESNGNYTSTSTGLFLRFYF